jgi:hypothetical protein
MSSVTVLVGKQDLLGMRGEAMDGCCPAGSVAPFFGAVKVAARAANSSG